jgi:hypothetical protein
MLRHKVSGRILSMVILVLLAFFGVFASAQSVAQDTAPELRVEFVSESGVSLQALAAGEPGSGFLQVWWFTSARQQPKTSPAPRSIRPHQN